MSLASGQKRAARWAVVAISILFVGLVVYRSFQVAGRQCDVCIEFRGERACRTVQGATDEEARMAAVTNTCARLAAGVTDTMACERTMPEKVECRAFN